MKHILVILPTYNERENIEPILTALFAVTKRLNKCRLGVLVVDDNSPDGTGSIVRSFMKTEARLHILTGRKVGLGKAYLRAFEWGLKQSEYDAFIMMDADFSHDPNAIPSLIKALDAGADYVIGSRYAYGGAIPGDWPLRRIIYSRAANSLARFLVGFSDIADTTGGFKAIRTASLRGIDLKSIRATGYFFQVNLLHEFWSRGLVIREVPIKFVDRRFGLSKLKLKDIVEFVYRAYKLNPNSRARRLFRFCLVGAAGTVVNLIVLHMLVRYGRLDALIAVAVAIEVSIISNFLLNHYYTFRFQNRQQASETIVSMLAKLFKYNLGTLGGAAISFLVFTLLFKLAGWFYIPADLLAIAAATAWNYWMSTKFVWRIVDGKVEVSRRYNRPRIAS